jgi:asparagine N-glycosylation enzyme membrane subunit Stt3
MKTHHYIFLTTILFVILFYDQSAGLNLGIIGLVYAVLTFIRTPKKNRTKTFLFLFAAAIASGFAFAWYGDFPSFMAVVCSLLMLGYRSRNRKMKILLLLPVFVTNFFTAFVRIFNLDEWLPKKNVPGLW